MKQIISLQIEDNLVNDLKLIAENYDMSVSALIRRLIKKYLEEQGREVRLPTDTK